MISTSRIALLIGLAFAAVLIVFWHPPIPQDLATTISPMAGRFWACQISGM
jgi:hypothetical protein